MIPQSFIDDLLNRIDIVALVSATLPGGLKKGGANYTACCPFHDEQTASFSVSPTKQFYHCFGCGAHGSAIGFLMEYKQISYPQAIREAAAFVGMEVPEEEKKNRTAEEREAAARYAKAKDALEKAKRIFSAKLLDSQEAMEYLMLERGLTQETIARFQLGLAPDAWDTLTSNKDFDPVALEDAGLSIKPETGKRYDRFRDRIMIPILSRKGVIGFGARALHGQEPKYLNSPETVVFRKGHTLFGFNEAIDHIKKAGRVFVFEGYFDAISLSQRGVPNVVATLGTAVTNDQFSKLFKLCEHITFCMDGDNAGRNAAWKIASNILPLMDSQHRVDFMFLPDGMDPDDFIRKEGKKAFLDGSQHARTLTEYIQDVLKRDCNMDNAEDLAAFCTQAYGMADKMSDKVLRIAFLKQISASAGLTLETMLDMLKKEDPADLPVEDKKASVPLPNVHVDDEKVQKQDSANVSVGAKLIALAAMSCPSFTDALDINSLSRFLGAEDREMLLPVLAYIAANKDASLAALRGTFAYSPHGKIIQALSDAVLISGMDYVADATVILDGYKRMENVWRSVVAAHQGKVA